MVADLQADEPTLFDFAGHYPSAPGFRKSAPETSRAAAPAKADARTLRLAVLAALEKGAKTADECAEALGESVLSVRPRLSELRTMGKILDTGIRRRNGSGKMACVWKVAPCLS